MGISHVSVPSLSLACACTGCELPKPALLRQRRPLSVTTKMQYKTPARPPLDRRGKNETEFQIYSRKSELHQARGTLTHKMKKITRTPTLTAELKKLEWGVWRPARLYSAVPLGRREAHAHTRRAVKRKKCVHIFLLFTIFMCVSGLRASGRANGGRLCSAEVRARQSASPRARPSVLNNN